MRPQLRLKQIRDDILRKMEQLKRDMIAESSTPQGGSGRRRGVQIDSPKTGLAWLTWGQRYTVDADYVLPKLVWLFEELALLGVPDLPQWTREPETSQEALWFLNKLLACCEGAMDTQVAPPAAPLSPLADSAVVLAPQELAILTVLAAQPTVAMIQADIGDSSTPKLSTSTVGRWLKKLRQRGLTQPLNSGGECITAKGLTLVHGNDG
jgi:hypothetical protein